MLFLHYILAIFTLLQHLFYAVNTSMLLLRFSVLLPINYRVPRRVEPGS